MATVEELQAEVDGLKAQLRDTKSESNGYRLNADRFKGELATARDEAAAAAKSAKDAFELERVDLTGRATAAERNRDEVVTASKGKVTAADLKMAAKEAGMVDLDGLKLLDMTKAKLDDDGAVTNGAELMAAMKEAKPYFFGAPARAGTETGNTGSPHVPPKPAAVDPKNVRAVPAADYAAARREYLASANRR